MTETNQHLIKSQSDTHVNGCKELLTEADWILGWSALTTLRPKLAQKDFLARKTELQLNGYHLVGLFRDEKVVSVASYTISPHPVFEREMIIHDMSTLSGESSKGYGTILLSYLDGLAIRLNCERTFVATTNATKFYTNNGYTAHATALKKLHQC
jgi:N-acetylglutamate synthase-like GNAT family acetyltransferase